MHPSFELTFLVMGLVTILAGLFGFLISQSQGARRSEGSKLKLLRKIPFLSDLTDEQLGEVGRLVKELRVPQESYVIREFRSGEAMFILVSGQVHILKKGAVDETLIQTKGPGELVGEMSLLTGARRVASVKSVTPCLLLQIDSADFEEFLAVKPEISKAVWEACELHTINLLSADFEKIRSLPLYTKKTWISDRVSRFVLAGETYLVPQTGFLALVAGTFLFQEKKLNSPMLIPVRHGDTFKVLERGRLAFLKDASALTLKEVA